MPVDTLQRWITFWYNLPGRVATRIWVGGAGVLMSFATGGYLQRAFAEFGIVTCILQKHLSKKPLQNCPFNSLRLCGVFLYAEGVKITLTQCLDLLADCLLCGSTQAS